MIRILVDSSADYQMQELREKQLELISLNIQLGEQAYQEGINLERNELYEKIEGGEGFPSTSQPSPQDFLDIFQKVKDQGDEIICILVSSALSGTYSCAVLAKNMVDYEGIHLIDSLAATHPIRILADHACELRTAGKTAQEICQSVEKLKSRVRVMAVVDTLEYLCRGGRISRTAATIGEMANLKPVVMITPEGKVEMIGKCLGINKSISFLMKKLQDIVLDPNYPVYSLYTYGIDNCIRLEERMEQDGCQVTERLQIGATIGTHVGPGAYGVVYVEA